MKHEDLVVLSESLKVQNESLKARNMKLQELLDEALNVQYDLKVEAISLKEKNTKLHVQAALGPEMLEKLGHKQDLLSVISTTKVPDTPAEKVKHNILKSEAETMNEILQQLEKNKQLEGELQDKTIELSRVQTKLDETLTELEATKKAMQELKHSVKGVITDSKSNKGKPLSLTKLYFTDTLISSLNLKIKARDTELNILKSEREEMYGLKEKLTEARNMIMTHGIIPDLHVSNWSY